MRADPFAGLSQFNPVVSEDVDPVSRVYRFPTTSAQLYERLQEIGGTNLSRLEFGQGWSGEFDPAKRELRVWQFEQETGFVRAWSSIKAWLGLEVQGCG